MGKEHTKESITKSHKVGIAGVFDITSYNEVFCSNVNILAVIISVSVSIIAYVIEINIQEIIKDVTDVLIAFLPGILGFTIAGFTLMVGFLQSDLLDSITEKPESSDYTLYQRTVSKFAICVLLQSFALIIGYAFHFAMLYDSKSNLQISDSLIKYINSIALVVIWYAFILSVFLVYQVVVNIFNFSQLHHFVIVKKKMKDSNPPDKKDA